MKPVNEEATTIRQLIKQFEDGFNSKNLDQLMQFYADKYVDVNLEHPVQTKDEKRKYYENLLNADRFSIKMNPEEIIISGDQVHQGRNRNKI